VAKPAIRIKAAAAPFKRMNTFITPRNLINKMKEIKKIIHLDSDHRQGIRRNLIKIHFFCFTYLDSRGGIGKKYGQIPSGEPGMPSLLSRAQSTSKRLSPTRLGAVLSLFTLLLSLMPVNTKFDNRTQT
jgi:hypothetical protein